MESDKKIDGQQKETQPKESLINLEQHAMQTIEHESKYISWKLGFAGFLIFSQLINSFIFLQRDNRPTLPTHHIPSLQNLLFPPVLLLIFGVIMGIYTLQLVKLKHNLRVYLQQKGLHNKSVEPTEENSVNKRNEQNEREETESSTPSTGGQQKFISLSQILYQLSNRGSKIIFSIMNVISIFYIQWVVVSSFSFRGNIPPEIRKPLPLVIPFNIGILIFLLVYMIFEWKNYSRRQRFNRRLQVFEQQVASELGFDESDLDENLTPEK